MRLTMREKKTITKALAERYKKANKKHKGIILDEFTELTGYNRSYLSYVLRIYGKKIRIFTNKIIIADITGKTRRENKKIYDDIVFNALKEIWLIMDCICGKRLAPMLGELISILEASNEIRLDEVTRQKLQRISASTIDRLLSKEKKKLNLKGRANTKPGTLLKNQIPIRTFSEWDEGKPGFIEIDLVGHDGGNPSGEFIQTLNVVDVLTGWTEAQAVRNKAQVWTFEALKDIERRLPFKLLGIDSDNGSEFINHHLLRYCQEHGITFTRTRSYRKNDNCFVEQKNYSVVRRAVGYLRYDTEEELKILNELYSYLSLYTNYFQPVMKLKEKTREGSKVRKRYDTAKTPYQRVLESIEVSEEDKERLREEYVKLNPAELKRQITRLQNKLLKIASLKEQQRQRKGER